jgi:hypothetical protein
MSGLAELGCASSVGKAGISLMEEGGGVIFMALNQKQIRCPTGQIALAMSNHWHLPIFQCLSSTTFDQLTCFLGRSPAL